MLSGVDIPGIVKMGFDHFIIISRSLSFTLTWVTFSHLYIKESNIIWIQCEASSCQS